MESNLVYFEKKISKNEWTIPKFLKTKEFSEVEEIKENPVAIIISPETFLKNADKNLFNAIIDCAENKITNEEIRDLCILSPFFIALSKEDKNLEKIFEKKEIPLNPRENGFMGIVYKSDKMEKIISLIKKVAKTDATVLIRGESGTGKEVVAKAIHNLSNRKNKNFVAVNCASIPETLLEAELFGHKKGAFTDAYTDRKGMFEIADKGTIFLDEIGDMPLSLQAKILRVLQEKEITPLGSEKSKKVDARVISATSRNLEEMIKNGEFREDLFYRLNVIPINLPPLRERKEDIEILAKHFLEKFSKKHSAPVLTIEQSGIEYLKKLEWRGNIRELENLMEKLVIFNRGKETLTAKDIENTIKGF